MMQDGIANRCHIILFTFRCEPSTYCDCSLRLEAEGRQPIIGWQPPFKDNWSRPHERSRTADPLFLPSYYRSKYTPLVDHQNATCASCVRLIWQHFILHSFGIWQQARCLLSCRPVVVLLKPIISNLDAYKSKIMAASCDWEN